MHTIKRLRRDHDILRLHETMTPNRIVRQYPHAHAIFDELLISLAFEGCDCLDEVAWRHGMAGQELLHKLEEVIRNEQGGLS